MASIKKFTDDAVGNLLKHDDRSLLQDRNTDIDPSRTYLNYDLTPTRTDQNGNTLTKLDYYNQRKAEVYCYNRSDVKTVAGCIVTLPREVTTPDEQAMFFSNVADFLSDRYGVENTISITVHYDEGKTLWQKDPITGDILTDDSGNKIKEMHIGQPHLHFLFMPVTKIDKDILMSKKNHVKAMELFDEKISAADVLTKTELKKLHPDLQKYLSDNHIPGRIITGITKEQGRNISVGEYKHEFERIKSLLQSVEHEKLVLQAENADLKEKVKTLEAEIEKSRSIEWGDAASSEWGTRGSTW